jgi:DNA-binding MarR family transcriptional regulator
MTEKKRRTMPLQDSSSLRKRKYFGFLLVATALFLYVFLSMPMGVSSAESGTLDNSVSSVQLSDQTTNMNYTAIITDPTLTTTRIILNGTMKRMVELPAESIVVMLPDDRLAIKSPDETSILPEGSTISYYEEKPVISVPQQSEVLGVSAVVVSPLQNFTVKTNFIQSIQELDVYSVQVVFFELARENPDVSLVNYRINWGDGNNGTYVADTIAVAHEYKKSGTYRLMVNVSDELGFTYVTTQQYTVNYEGHLSHSYLWVNKNKGPVTAVSASFGLLAFGLLVFTESGKYKLLLLFTLLLPLYSRIQKEDVLDQFVRGQIYGFIKTNPGVHYNQILRKVGVKNGTLSYHLGVLEKTELIQSRREGLKYRAFYPTGMNFPKAERFRLTDLQIKIIGSIRSQPGLTQKEIAQLLGQKPQTINYNIKVLGQAGLISVVKAGRKTRCFPVSDVDNSGQ